MHLRHKGMVPLVLVLSLITPLARSTATPGSEVYSHQLTQSSQDGRDFIVRDITMTRAAVPAGTGTTAL
jgi:hypothetical protein